MYPDACKMFIYNQIKCICLINKEFLYVSQLHIIIILRNYFLTLHMIGTLIGSIYLKNLLLIPNLIPTYRVARENLKTFIHNSVQIFSGHPVNSHFLLSKSGNYFAKQKSHFKKEFSSIFKRKWELKVRILNKYNLIHCIQINLKKKIESAWF